MNQMRDGQATRRADAEYARSTADLGLWPDPTPGMLAHNLPEGRSACPACGWVGEPPVHEGRLLHTCPGCEPDILDAVRELIDEEVAADYRRAGTGRNDPCPCGSGRKFKKCHGR